MTISLQHQDPIEVQPVPRYGRSDIIRGAISFDEENLAAFEKVKLVVRPPPPLICTGIISVLAGNLLRLREKRRSEPNHTKDAQKFSCERPLRFGKSLGTMCNVHKASISKSRSLLLNPRGVGWKSCHPRTFSMPVKGGGFPVRTRSTSTSLKSPDTRSGTTGIGAYVIHPHTPASYNSHLLPPVFESGKPFGARFFTFPSFERCSSDMGIYLFFFELRSLRFSVFGMDQSRHSDKLRPEVPAATRVSKRLGIPSVGD